MKINAEKPDKQPKKDKSILTYKVKDENIKKMQEYLNKQNGNK